MSNEISFTVVTISGLSGKVRCYPCRLRETAERLVERLAFRETAYLFEAGNSEPIATYKGEGA